MIGEDNILTLTYHDFTTSWVESQKAEAESLRAKYKAGSDGYKSLTKRITLYNRAIREAEK